VLEGGVNDALNLDGHGKTHSFLVLSLPVRVPRASLDDTDTRNTSRKQKEGTGA